MKAAGWVCIAIGVLMIIPAMEASDGSGIIFGFLILIGIILIQAAPDFEKRKNKKESKTLFDYDEENYKLNLYKRDKKISKMIKIVSDRAINVAYEPEKLHFGAVSVGGVTSGGFYTTGGYNYISSMPKNGKFRMEYNGKMIKSIHLSSDLLQIAQNSPLKTFLYGSEIRVVDKVDYSDFELNMMVAQMNKTGFANSELLKRGYPSEEKCMVILSWMAGDI